MTAGVREWGVLQAIGELLGGSRVGAAVQVSVSFPASPLADVIVGL
jgi:hypothetical protein